MPRPSYQPLHGSVRPNLDPEYIAFHDTHLQYVRPSEAEQWDPASRDQFSPLSLGGQRPVDVGKVEDRLDLGTFQLRIFTPEGEVPSSGPEGKGWPVLVWFHGGGWVMGGLGSENGFLRHVCKYVGCVVISVNYRHAPEHCYPGAVEDVVAGYQWIVDPSNAETLKIDTERLAIGGLSAGGCLTAILSLKLSEFSMPIPSPIFQILICPVIDNTASTSTIWSASQHAPWLTPSRMTWYRNMYFPDPATDAHNWDASPCFAPEELLSRCPRTFLAISECDLLAPEAVEFGQKLRDAGVDTKVEVYQGATHSVLVLAGIHQTGKKLVHDACAALAEALGTTYDPQAAPILPLD